VTEPLPDLEEFRAGARSWLEANGTRRVVRSRAEEDAEIPWGVGDDSVAIFLNLTHEEEEARLRAAREWQAKKMEAGYGAIAWPVEYGGRGLPVSYVRAFNQEEAQFETPNPGELFPTSLGLIAPTSAAWGTDVQKTRVLAPLLRAEVLGCQLFSEPGAGSDLASVSTKAVLDGDEWVLSGQKVWTSGAVFADWGLAVCRTDPDVPKHRGITTFLVPLQHSDVEIRPIRQMSGGANFNEVFLNDIRLPDDLRLGPVGDGWRVALTCLGFERDHSGGGGGHSGGGFKRLVALAKHLGKLDDPIVRQDLMRVLTGSRVMQYTNRRAAAALKAGQTPGPEGSLSKLMWTQDMTRVSDVATRLLGALVLADTGEWGTFAWNEHLLGAPGYRIAGGSDEIQRNIIGERVLGLPPEPRVDRDVPFSQAQKAARGG